MIRIGTLIFDDCVGEIDLPGWQSIIFTLPGTRNTGVHLNPPVAQVSELTLTRFGFAVESGLIFAQQKQLEASEQYITLGRVDYASAHRLKFHIAKITPVTTEEIPHASGHRVSGTFDYTPACRIITKWQVLPLPI